MAALRSEVAGAEDKLRRLYRMVEEGMTALDEILKDRLKTLKEERDRAAAALDRIRVAERPPRDIAPELECFPPKWLPARRKKMRRATKR